MKPDDRLSGVDPITLFSQYMRVAGVPTLDPEPGPFRGKSVGIINGSSWINLWSMYFGRRYLPGAKLVSVGNEGVQLNFMDAHRKNLDVPPPLNRRIFRGYARQLAELVHVDAILLTCSTMNRAYREVKDEVGNAGIPVVQIDEPMMREAVRGSGPVLIIATHGPTVESTRALLQETAEELGARVTVVGETVEEAFEALGQGDIARHNRLIESCIRRVLATQPLGAVVLAQLSMAVFSLEHPDPRHELGVPVLTSAELGFRAIAEILTGRQSG